jgi:cholesterol transport system auxiliary component
MNRSQGRRCARALPAWLLAVSTALWLAGCSGGLLSSDIPPPETFRIAHGTSAGEVSASAAGARAAPPLAITVGRPRASGALDTDRIAVAEAGNRFDYYSGARWAESAPAMVQQTLASALSDSGSFAGVFAAPARAPAELLLDLELRRFEAEQRGNASAPVVHVELQGALVDSRVGRRVASFVSRASVPATENRLAAVVDAFDRATAQAVSDVVTRVQQAAATASVATER